MGVEYYLADTRRRRIFWLGKGQFFELTRERPLPDSPQAMLAAVEGVCSTWSSARPEWIRSLACRMWAFVSTAGRENVALRHDASDYEDEWRSPERWPIVGSRYDEDADDLAADPLREEMDRAAEEALRALGREGR